MLLWMRPELCVFWPVIEFPKNKKYFWKCLKNSLQWASLIEVPELSDRHLPLAAHPCAYTFLSTDALPQISSASRLFPIFVSMDQNVWLCPGEYRTLCGGFMEGDLQALMPPSQTKGAGMDWHVPEPSWDHFGRNRSEISFRESRTKGRKYGSSVIN